MRSGNHDTHRESQTGHFRQSHEQFPLDEPPVLSVMRPFAKPLISSEAIVTCAADLCAELAGALAAKALGAKAVRLSLYRADGTVAEVLAKKGESLAVDQPILSFA